MRGQPCHAPLGVRKRSSRFSSVHPAQSISIPIQPKSPPNCTERILISLLKETSTRLSQIAERQIGSRTSPISGRIGGGGETMLPLHLQPQRHVPLYIPPRAQWPALAAAAVVR